MFTNNKNKSLYFERMQMVDMVRDLDSISYKEFPKFIGELYSLMGYKVEYNEGKNNIDLYTSKFSEKLAIQVKAYSLDYIKSKAIKKISVQSFALQAREERRKPVYITTGVYTNPAYLEAKKLGVTLIDRKNIFDLILKADPSLLAEVSYLESVEKHDLKKCKHCRIGHATKIYSEETNKFYYICMDCKKHT
ncbi:restriction endonuclease [Enterococcus sp. AZ029]|uniref:restriction endonuclease n=1 Tax=Enterococcus sp. AZ029 TaxID=2774841 RepID=UPI003F239A99